MTYLIAEEGIYLSGCSANSKTAQFVYLIFPSSMRANPLAKNISSIVPL
nr:MAG TPA: hypothetical protein [Caudoviricetes sp.]